MLGASVRNVVLAVVLAVNTYLPCYWERVVKTMSWRSLPTHYACLTSLFFITSPDMCIPRYMDAQWYLERAAKTCFKFGTSSVGFMDGTVAREVAS